MDYNLKMQRCQALEEEQKKIQVFKRELPLCLELITQAIEECRKDLSELSTLEQVHGLSECSERTTSECGGGGVAVFEEFIPIKRCSSSSDEHESCVRDEDEVVAERIAAENNGDKMKSDWLNLGSVQLWNQSPDPQTTAAAVVVEVKRNGAAFQPFQKEKEKTVAAKSDSQPQKPITPSVTTSSSTAETGGSRRETEQQKQSQMHRKQRRCWSPELHRRFLHALQQLGGSHVATPKQIRDLMKVDGLTNDEVKSHLQKYRLHTRRPATSTATMSGEPPQPPQFMVVEGIWVPSSHDTTNNRVYTPVAAKPPQSSPSGERSNRRCKSPATSSTHTQHVLSLS